MRLHLIRLSTSSCHLSRCPSLTPTPGNQHTTAVMKEAKHLTRSLSRLGLNTRYLCLPHDVALGRGVERRGAFAKLRCRVDGNGLVVDLLDLTAWSLCTQTPSVTIGDKLQPDNTLTMKHIILTFTQILVSVGGPSAPRASDFFRFSLTSVSLSSSSTLSSSFCLHSDSSSANRCSTPQPVQRHTEHIGKAQADVGTVLRVVSLTCSSLHPFLHLLLLPTEGNQFTSQRFLLLLQLLFLCQVAPGVLLCSRLPVSPVLVHI